MALELLPLYLSSLSVAESGIPFPMNRIKGRASRALPGSGWLAGAVLCAFAIVVGACSPDIDDEASEGDAQRGLLIIERAGCGSCHIIPGVPLSDGFAGPPLDHFGNRSMIAGMLPNTPDHLIRWLRFPQSVVPGNVMPDTGLSEEQARDAAAYLRTLD